MMLWAIFFSKDQEKLVRIQSMEILFFLMKVGLLCQETGLWLNLTAGQYSKTYSDPHKSGSMPTESSF